MDIPETELADLILRVARQLRRANALELEGLPVNPHQARALRVVARLEPVRMADLAERLHVAPRSATDVVDFLVEGGWVERTPDPEDRRARRLTLTDAGRALLGSVLDARARAAESTFAGLDASARTALAATLGPAFDSGEATPQGDPHHPPHARTLLSAAPRPRAPSGPPARRRHCGSRTPPTKRSP